jgi:hypothetical protein
MGKLNVSSDALSVAKMDAICSVKRTVNVGGKHSGQRRPSLELPCVPTMAGDEPRYKTSWTGLGLQSNVFLGASSS